MTATVLIVDDEESPHIYAGEFLRKHGYEVISAYTLEEARTHLKHESADIILLDIKLPDGYGPNLLEESLRLPMRPPIILITAWGDIETAVNAMKGGAHDFLQKPIKLDQLLESVKRAEELVSMRRELLHLRKAQTQELDFVVSKSQVMKYLLAQIQRVANTSVSLLLTGESGTGKDILAKATHQMGIRKNKPFVAINCPAIPSTLVESELFGHEKGAFSDANTRKYGLMEVADGGILFLDEISSLPLELQAKLLRALEDRSFRRVGGTQEIKVDVQLITATNKDLETMIHENTFREDLYYRLKVVHLHVPPLRERVEDIPDLVGLFIRRNNASMGLNIKGVTPRVMDQLMNYSWPGNIRQLRHVIERAMTFCDDELIDLAHLPPELFPKHL